MCINYVPLNFTWLSVYSVYLWETQAIDNINIRLIVFISRQPECVIKFKNIIQYLRHKSLFTNSILNTIDLIIVTDILIKTLTASSTIIVFITTNNRLFFGKNTIFRFIPFMSLVNYCLFVFFFG